MWYMIYSQIMWPRPPLPRKVGVMTPQLLWERRPCWPQAESKKYMKLQKSYNAVENSQVWHTVQKSAKHSNSEFIST